ncbi:MAG: hypothetical protein Q4C77_10365 [Eubacteriales bacterium]|nr:hypothetical protein [Eubacteriales bacterium]
MHVTQYTPLSPEEQAFAEKHHYLIEGFLKSRKLPLDDWYDVVVFRYLLSVKKWFQQPELHCYKFSTIAWNAMGSAVHNERKKQERRIQPVSLDSPIPGTEDMTLMDTITYENLQYLYTGEKDMNISYNVKIPEKVRLGAPRKKSDEVIAVESFLESKMKNMCFDYEEEGINIAKSRTKTLQYYRRKHELQEKIDVFRIDNKVYVTRKEQEKNEHKNQPVRSRKR